MIDRFPRLKNRRKLTLVINEALDGAVPSYSRLGEIVVHVDVGLLRVGLLDAVVARDRQRGPRGGVLSQPEALRYVGIIRHRRDRVVASVFVAIADFTGSNVPARAVPAELATERERESSAGGSILTLGIPLARRC